MSLSRRSIVGLAQCAAACAVLIALANQPALSQTRTVKFVVPFPPGGGADLLMRVLAEQIGKAQNVSTVIENRPGAATIIATEAVSRAAPDGNTLLIVANSFIIHPNFKKLSYDPLTSFEPVCLLATSPQVIVVNSESPYRTLAELIDAARAKPGELSHASVGPGSTQHIAFEQLKLLAKVRMVYVPFNGNGPSLNALLGGHVAAVMANYAEVAEHVSGGKLRALAVASKSRIPTLPQVPTIAEQGYKDYAVDVWYGLVTPAKTSKEAVAELAQWCSAGMLSSELKPKWDLQGLEPVGRGAADFAAHLRQQADEYARVVRDAGIKGE
jgi:tripartite-type tricarboxylate transporter receptor subunit TctC